MTTETLGATPAAAEMEHATDTNARNWHNPHKQTKRIADQLARTAGHVSSIKRMVEEGRDCSDVLIQLAAVRSAIDRVSKLVLKDHLESCLGGAATGMAAEEWAQLKTALDSFIR